MYKNELDLIKEKLTKAGQYNTSKIIKHLINAHEDSDKLSEMQTGVRYYEQKHDILGRQRTYTVGKVEYVDENKSNNKLMHSWFTNINKQKVAYILSNPITWTTGNKKTDDRVAAHLGNRFDKTLKNLTKNATNKGVEWLHVFKGDGNKFGKVIIKAEECIPIYDTKFETELIQMLRYYGVKYIKDGKEKMLNRVEWWYPDHVEYWVENVNGEYELESEGGHWELVNDVTGEVTMDNWGRVPFIPFRNNEEEINDLRGIKNLIDDYDVNRSDLSNDLSEIQERVYVLKGYSGAKESLSDFMTNVKFYKVISVDEDGGVDTVQSDIAVDARKEHIEQLKRDIFALGMAVLHDPDKFGQNPSGIALKFMYAYLDLNASDYIIEAQVAIEELFWFIGKHEGIELDLDDVQVTFNKSMIINETEMVNNANMSIGSVSEDTRLSNHPWVTDVATEKEKMTEENQGVNLDAVT